MSIPDKIFVPLYDFLKTASLEQITVSRIFTQQWKLYKIQSKKEDCECLINILKSVENEIINAERKKYIQLLLQDVDRIYYSHDELVSLVDAGELRGNFKEYIDWRNIASNNLTILKSTIKNGGTSAHDRIFTNICEVRVEELSQDDPLCNGVVDLSSDKYQLSENNHIDLMGEKAGIRKLSKSSEIKRVCADFVLKREEIHRRKFVLSSSKTVSHSQWVEEEHEKECVAREITNVLLQEIKLNAFENKIEITRAERQSIASKNRKLHQQKGSRGDKPDLMIRVFFRNRWEEIVYVESGKWNCGFGVNIAGEYIEIYGLVREKGVKYYFPVSRAKIPFRKESTEEMEGFIHALLTLQNGIIVNIQTIANNLQKKSRKNNKRSPEKKDNYIKKVKKQKY